MKLTWVSTAGDEYQAMIGSLQINLKPLPNGTFQILDSESGAFYRRERDTIAGPLANAMNRVENHYTV